MPWNDWVVGLGMAAALIVIFYILAKAIYTFP